jgi:hypothetical protein
MRHCRNSHLLLLLPVVLFVSCATDRHTAAIQQTAVGGGFVAMGATVAAAGLVSTGLSAFSLASVQGIQAQDAALAIGIPATGTIVASGLLVGLGAFLMNSVEADLANAAIAPRPAINQPLQPPPATTYSTPQSPVAAPPSPGLPPTPPVGLNWRALTPAMSAARRTDGAILVTFAAPVLPAGCAFYTLTGKGASLRVDPAPNWQNTIVITPDAQLDVGTDYLLEGCGISLPIARESVFNISRIRSGF